MRSKIIFAAGAAVGYVLGARDGRGRYEQIKSQADSLWNDPRVQDKVSSAQQSVKAKTPEVQAKVAEVAGTATAAAKDKASNVTSAAKDKVKGTSSAPSSNLTGQESGSNYTPAATKFNSAQ